MKDIHKYALNGVVGIADLDNTFGHIPLMQESKKHGFKPIYGVRLRVSRPENEKRQTGHLYTTFLAKNQEGLTALYLLVKKAWDQFYYFPRLYTRDIENLHPCIINLGEGIHENFYPEDTLEDRCVYQIIAGASKRGDGYIYNFSSRVGDMHIVPGDYQHIVDQCEHVEIPKANMVKWGKQFDLMEICKKSAKLKGISLDGKYGERLNYELDLITQKNYNDYFMIVADMIKEAKRTMLVGPSRGSSAGSLVCYLMGITEVDPIEHKLIFERFIDINRFDLPDIDVDFPDRSRQDVIDYLVKKYGRDNVRTLGTVGTFMPKSALGEVAKALNIPAYVIGPAKDAIIERSSGDARSAMCIEDTLNTTKPGQELIAMYPKIAIAGRFEGHAAQAGKHAAGVIVSTEPLYKYAGINSRDDILMMDKRDAEAINLLKIDALGLRTLSILEDCVKQIPKMKFSDVYRLPLNDQKTFALFNNMRLSGIFQFEGLALQILTKQMGVNCFNDIAAITALARPGALNSGGAARYVKYHTGQDDTKYFNDIHKEITEETYGITVYQEQMMEIARRIGRFSWKDVSTLRKAASKSLGDEFFGQYRERFIEGAKDSGLGAAEAEDLWNDISHSGSWSFNKCLSGDTVIRMAQPGMYTPVEMTIRELYRMYKITPMPYVKKRMNKGIGPKLISLYPDGRCRPQYSCDIVYSGRKEVYKYTFSNNSSVKCTVNHKFIINKQWREIGSAQIGDEFLIGEYEKTKRESTKHLQGSGYIPSGKPGHHIGANAGEHNPSYINGMGMHLSDQQDIARLPTTTCEDCGCYHNRMEVHHNDFNNGYIKPFDTSILCPSCHKKRHYSAGRTKQWGKGYTTNTVTLASIEYVGVEDVYDIEMPEHHNFILKGGLITHNSHAVSYGLVSYWTAYFKANYPLEFAVASLNNARDPEHAIKLLRDMVKNEGFEYLPVSAEKSGLNWSVIDGKIVGGLNNIVNIGDVKAEKFIKIRSGKLPPTPKFWEIMSNPKTPYDIIFPTEHYWGKLFNNPKAYGLDRAPQTIETVEGIGEYIIVGCLVDRNLRDLNEYTFLKDRNGEVIENNHLYLNFTVEDDTGSIMCKIDRWKFESLGGKKIAEEGKVGHSWYLIRGKIKNNWRKIEVEAISNLHDIFPDGI